MEAGRPRPAGGEKLRNDRSKMQRKAKVFMHEGSQAVCLPKAFEFDTEEVFIRKEGSTVVLSPRPCDWGSYFDEEPAASDEFMEYVEDSADL